MIMTRSRTRARQIDFISQLPDEILCLILSLLSIDEIARTNVLSKRWRGLWKSITTHLEFDGRRMILPLAQRQDPREALRPYSQLGKVLYSHIGNYGLTIFSMLFYHSNDLHSCRFIHFPYSICREEVVNWLRQIRGKNVKNLSLECEFYDIGTLYNSLQQLPVPQRFSKPNFPMGIFSGLCSLQLIRYDLRTSKPFEGCENVMKTLILKSVNIDSETLDGILRNCKGLENICLFECFGFRNIEIHSPNLKVLQLNALVLEKLLVFAERLEVLLLDTITWPGSMKIYSPSLRVIHCYNHSIFGSALAIDEERIVLKAFSLLFNFRYYWDSGSNILLTLSKLSIDIDLNNAVQSILFTAFLGSCTCLETLEITLPAIPSDDLMGRFSYWNFENACDCVQNQLKFVHLRGFRGRNEEFAFLRFIIAEGRKLERITIICSEAIDGQRLMAIKSASPNLSVILKFKIHSVVQEINELQGRGLISYK